MAQAPPAPAPPDAKQIQHMQAQLADWPDLARYRAANAALAAPAAGQQRVVFMGDSITDGWGRWNDTGEFFPGKPYVNRGISGQTTPQMLVRFQQDVVDLHPAVVVILAGTNDIAGNTGPSTPQMIEDNFTSMADIAKQSGIKVVLASITPAYAYPWKPGIQPVEEIRALNQWLREFCSTNGYVYLDYYDSMADEKGAMLPGYAKDGVHPTSKGYGVMAPLAEQAIAKALAQ
jgi:lysophospholipase L1-like esterase